MSNYRDYKFLLDTIIKIIESASRYNNGYTQVNDSSYYMWEKHSREMLTIAARDVNYDILLRYMEFQSKLYNYNLSNSQKISYSVEYLKELFFLLQKI